MEVILFVSKFSKPSMMCMGVCQKFRLPVKFVFLDTEEARERVQASESFSIKSVPTLIVIYPDSNITTLLGTQLIMPWLEQYFNNISQNSQNGHPNNGNPNNGHNVPRNPTREIEDDEEEEDEEYKDEDDSESEEEQPIILKKKKSPHLQTRTSPTKKKEKEKKSKKSIRENAPPQEKKKKKLKKTKISMISDDDEDEDDEMIIESNVHNNKSRKRLPRLRNKNKKYHDGDGDDEENEIPPDPRTSGLLVGQRAPKTNQKKSKGNANDIIRQMEQQRQQTLESTLGYREKTLPGSSRN
jgi:hypothetical protein